MKKQFFPFWVEVVFRQCIVERIFLRSTLYEDSYPSSHSFSLSSYQGMEATYSVTVGNIECAYFDKVEKLYGFGSQNGESLARLVWAFFSYWAYCHDYANDVISIRSGSTVR